MAEFQIVCKHLKRMCERYGNNCIKCPLVDKDFCSLSAGDRTAETYKKAEEIIMSWAAEHPVVYPTWGEYFGMIYGARLFGNPIGSLNEIFKISIPQDIAEKLGVEPKEEK